MESDIVEQARKRAISYRECGPSAEHTASMLDELVFQIERLRAELAAAIKQRDEARIRVCELCARMGGVYRRINREVVECKTPEEIAEVCGWDCYAQKEGGGA